MSRPVRAIQARQTRGAGLIDAAQQVLAAHIATGQVMTVAGVARHAGCSRDFLYRHGFGGTDGLIAAANHQIADDRASEVDLTHRQTMHTLEVDLANTRTENQTLRRYVKALEQRLGEQLGSRDAAGPDPAERIDHLVNENDQLRRRVVEIEEAKDELHQRMRLLRNANIADVQSMPSRMSNPN